MVLTGTAIRRFISGCTIEAARSIRVSNEKEKVSNILNVLIPCNNDFDMLMNLFFIRENIVMCQNVSVCWGKLSGYMKISHRCLSYGASP